MENYAVPTMGFYEILCCGGRDLQVAPTSRSSMAERSNAAASSTQGSTQGFAVQ
jgi:hypothetical protein